ncbi:MAG: PAS domain S-box protein [Aquabacterium sp.]
MRTTSTKKPRSSRKSARATRCSIETVRMRKDGSLVDISLAVSPIRNAAGEVVGASKIVRDVEGKEDGMNKPCETTAALERAYEESWSCAFKSEPRPSRKSSPRWRSSPTRSRTTCGSPSGDEGVQQRTERRLGPLFEAEPEARRSVERILENCTRLDKMIHDVLTYGRIAREVGDTPGPFDALIADTLHHSLPQAPNAIVEVGHLELFRGMNPP